VIQSDLYALGWKAVHDEHDFPDRLDRERLSFVAESGRTAPCSSPAWSAAHVCRVRHVLAGDVAPGVTGLRAHLR
jgi:hypothetical protein